MNTLNTSVPAQALGVPRIAIDCAYPQHCKQGAAAIALLNHVANQPGGCSRDDLLPVYRAARANERPECATPENLCNLLYKLTEKNHLISEGRGQSCRWHLGAEARTTQHRQAQMAETYVGLRAPAPQYDLRRAPVYVPAPSAAPRAGSLDFQRLRSHGYGC